MKYDNFVMVGTTGSGIGTAYYAEVDEIHETGFLWWKKKTVARVVVKRYQNCYWMFIRDGRYSKYEIDRLERSFQAKEEFEKLTKGAK